VSIPKLAFIATLILSASGMWVNVIHAQDEEDPDLQRAVMLFEESEAAYNDGRFDEAAAMLRRAYSLHDDPLLLFNLARALEGDGDLDGAIESYQQYIDEAPDAEDRGAVEARLRTLRAQRDELADDGDEEEEEEEEEIAEEEEDDAGGGVSLAPWLTAAGGLAVVAVGGVFGAMSQSKALDADNEPVQETAKALHDDASTMATLANVFFVVGGVIVAAGVTWGVIDLMGDDEEGEPDADLAILPGGLLVTGRF